MIPYAAVEMIRVMNTDLAQLMERDQWRRARPELYPAEQSWVKAMLRWRRPSTPLRLAAPKYELQDARL